MPIIFTPVPPMGLLPAKAELAEFQALRLTMDDKAVGTMLSAQPRSTTGMQPSVSRVNSSK